MNITGISTQIGVAVDLASVEVELDV